MIMIKQTALDGRSDLGWLLTLQHDPPSALFVDHQALPLSSLRPFSPLADQRLVATTLAFVRELDTLSTKRAEFAKQKPVQPSGPKSDPKTGEAQLSRKQLRAGQRRRPSQRLEFRP